MLLLYMYTCIYTVHVARRRLAAVAALLAAHSVARDELAAAAARCYDGATLDRQCPSTLLFLCCWQLCGAAAMASCCWLTVGPTLLAGCRRRGPEPATWTVPCAGARLWCGAKGSCFSSTLAVHPERTRLPCLVRPTTRCLADWQSAASHCHTVAIWRVIQGRGVRPLPAEACAMGGVCCMGGGGCDCHCLHHLRATRYLPRGRRHRASLPDAGLTIHDERYHPGAQTRHGLRADADSR